MPRFAHSLLLLAVLCALTFSTAFGDITLAQLKKFKATLQIDRPRPTTITVFSEIDAHGKWTVAAQIEEIDGDLGHQAKFVSYFLQNKFVYTEQTAATTYYLGCEYFDFEAHHLIDTAKLKLDEVFRDIRCVHHDLCEDAKFYRFRVKRKPVILVVKDSKPVLLISSHEEYVVTSFESGATWAPQVNLAAACSAESLYRGQPAKAPVAHEIPPISKPPTWTDELTPPALHSWAINPRTIHLPGPALIHDNPNMQTVKVRFRVNKCTPEMQGNGHCDPDCNNPVYGYDAGDCCEGVCKFEERIAEHARYPCGSSTLYPTGYDCKIPAGYSVPCVFLHGFNVPGSANMSYWSQITSTRPFGIFGSYGVGSTKYYWGQLESELQGLCTEFLYNYVDTKANGWSNPDLQRRTYQAAKAVYDRGGVVFAHSMANMILGGACMDQNLCDLKWYHVGGPVRGSDSANGVAFFPGTDQAVQFATTLLTGPAMLTLATAYRGLKDAPDISREKLARVIAEKRLVLGGVCGISTYGGGGVAGAALAVAGTLVYGFFRPNDGVVALDECERFGYLNPGTNNGWHYGYLNGASPAVPDPDNPWFICRGNHLDLVGVNGNVDDIFVWYRNRVLQGRQTFAIGQA